LLGCVGKQLDIEIPHLPASVLDGMPKVVRDHIVALEGIIETLLGHVKELSLKVEEAGREGKRQATPFRTDKKRRRKKRKKPGRKGGHQQERRSEPDHVDETDEAPHAERCSCGGCVKTVEVYEQTQDDVEPRKVVRRIRIYVGECEQCGKKVEGRSPFQASTARGNADHQIGPTALALAADLHFGQGVPYDKVREHLQHLGIEVATSTLVRAMERIAGRLEATFKALMDQVLAHEVIHIDETSWYVDGEPCWLWVVTGKEATVYFVRRTRSSDEVADFLKDFTGVFVSDGAKAYDKLGKSLTRALCLLHLKRNVKALATEQTKGAVRFPRAVEQWIDEAIALVGRREQLKETTFNRKARQLEKRFQKLLKSRTADARNVKLLERLQTWQDAVLRCLRNPSVPATNNHAEHQVRPAVPIRKRGGCNRSERGAHAFERIASILATCRQRGVASVKAFVAFLRQPNPRAAFTFWNFGRVDGPQPIALLGPPPAATT
jgi:transposase